MTNWPAFLFDYFVNADVILQMLAGRGGRFYFIFFKCSDECLMASFFFSKIKQL